MIERLLKAIEEKRVVGIKYVDANGNVSERNLTPSNIRGDKLVAFCHKSGINKTFKIDKIVLLDAPLVIDFVSVIDNSVKKYETLFEFYERNKILLDSFGYVDILENGLSIHKLKKNGTPYISSVVDLKYMPESSCVIVDVDKSEKPAFQLSQRPYYLRVKGLNTSTFKYFDSACGKLLSVLENMKGEL